MRQVDWTIILAASIAAIPSTIAAWNSRKTKKTTETSNGKTLAEIVQKFDKKLDVHVKNANAHMREQTDMREEASEE